MSLNSSEASVPRAHDKARRGLATTRIAAAMKTSDNQEGIGFDEEKECIGKFLGATPAAGTISVAEMRHRPVPTGPALS